jgi:hypothetical protein
MTNTNTDRRTTRPSTGGASTLRREPGGGGAGILTGRRSTFGELKNN